jgi:MoaA/NifB/PqqE/SkfB family radical SAM enzyme
VYCTERRARDERAAIAPAAVRAAIDAATRSAEGAPATPVEVVLTGGEPTMRRDLPDLVAHAARRGARRVVVETNAAAVDVAMARALRDAGLAVARVHLAAPGDAADAVTRDPGGAARAVDGMRALRAAGVALEASTALVAPTASALPGLGPWLAEVLRAADGRAGPLDGPLWVAFPVEAPDPGVLLPPAEAARVLRALDAEARPHAITVRLRPDAALPPCLFPPVGRPTHLYSLSGPARPREGRVHVAACARCDVRDRCEGLDARTLSRFGAPPMSPIEGERARRRLALIESIPAQIARELVAPSRHVRPDGVVVPETIVRVNFHCNQACDFCFVSTHLPPPEEAAVRRAIREAARAGHRVCLSGGEPTLHPRLAEYVRLAFAEGAPGVQLQTNAVRLSDPAAVQPLVEAGLREAFVSLHASHATLSDAITGAPGTFDRTVAGLDALVAAGLEVAINFVIHRDNVHDLPAWVRLVASRWPGARASVSFVAPSTDLVPRALVPRYTDALPALREALDVANAAGVEVTSLESMCGMPLCLLPEDLVVSRPTAAIAAYEGDGEFLRVEACASCSVADRCFGVRRSYAAVHGTTEFRPIARAPRTPPGPPPHREVN